MATRAILPTDVFSEAIDRMIEVYNAGHRVVVSFSGGKDSTCVLNVCKIAAQVTGRLPVEVVIRDEEIALPGVYEYVERTRNDPDVKLHWLIAHQPVINIYNRREPYFWVFDPQLKPEQWFREPPSGATYIKELNIEAMTIPDRFPPPPGKKLIACIGLRTQESQGRLYGLYSSGGYLTKPNKYGVVSARPIYDWTDGDVWKAILDNQWDYCSAYDTLYRMGTPKALLRIAPPTMNAYGLKQLQLASRAWPRWFDRLCERLDGVRSGVNYGKRAIMAQRRNEETWEECFKRTCIDTAPKWIADRSKKIAQRLVHTHERHASSPLPQIHPCKVCQSRIGSWKKLTEAMYSGDPFSVKQKILPYVEPEFFRAGAGTWGGSTSF